MTPTTQLEPELPELLPCPFCNSTLVGLEEKGTSAYVLCAQCAAEGPWMDASETSDHINKATAAWNRRSPTQQTGESDLPPLPKSEATKWHAFKYTDSHMRAYALSAIAADRNKREDSHNYENFQKLVDAMERIYKDDMACAADFAADTLVGIGYWERTGGSKRAVIQEEYSASPVSAGLSDEDVYDKYDR